MATPGGWTVTGINMSIQGCWQVDVFRVVWWVSLRSIWTAAPGNWCLLDGVMGVTEANMDGFIRRVDFDRNQVWIQMCSLGDIVGTVWCVSLRLIWTTAPEGWIAEWTNINIHVCWQAYVWWIYGLQCLHILLKWMDIWDMYVVEKLLPRGARCVLFAFMGQLRIWPRTRNGWYCGWI